MKMRKVYSKILPFLMVSTSFLWAAENPFLSGPQKDKSSDTKCTVCHIRWFKTFEKEIDSTIVPFVKTNRQAASSDMCLSCHDGSVVDSREKVWTTDNHVTGKKPSNSVNIPTDKFPLDDNGKINCATCHTAHAIKGDSDLKTVVFLRQPNENSNLCLSCHTSFKKNNHHPLGPQKEKVPQKIIEAGGMTSKNKNAIYCQTCHAPHGAEFPKMLVMPVKTLCISCHENKSPEVAKSSGQAMHRIGQKFPEFVPPETLVKAGAKFGPKGELSCLSCHDMHQSKTKENLLVKENNKGSLCIDCHESQRSVVGTTHDMNKSAPKAFNIDSQTVAESGVCGSCHKSHGWAKKQTTLKSQHQPLCVECHQEGGMAWEKKPYVEMHPVDVAVPKGLKTSLPLQVDGDKRKINCQTCHDPHAKDKLPSMLRLPKTKLCTECHEDKKMAGGVHDPLGKEWAEKLDFVSKDLCSNCHSAHKPHPDSGNVPFAKLTNSDKVTCTGCHKEEGFGQFVKTAHTEQMMDTSISHPLGKKTKGNNKASIICSSCHDIHQPKEEKHLMRTAISQTGMCTDCHKNGALIKDSHHDLSKSAPDFKNQLGETPTEAGLCRSCHLIHETDKGRGLWAFDTLLNTNKTEALCESCHQKGGIAKAMVVKDKDHPDLASFNKKDTETTRLLPIFDDHGNDSSLIKISCNNCHDPHGGPLKTDSKETKTATTLAKFLLPQVKEELCSSCHGAEGLWRLLYFHNRDRLPFPAKGMPYKPQSELGEEAKAKRNMNNCMACHEQVPIPFDHKQVNWTKAEGHGIQARIREQDCKTCHEEKNDCLNCHTGMNSEFSHEPNYKYTHGIDVKFLKKDCTACHAPIKQFCGDCHEKKGIR